MKLLICSDSHGEADYLCAAAEKEKPDGMILLGDHASDGDRAECQFPKLPLCRVRGNCDYYDQRWPEEALFCWENVRIFAVHGHRYGVKNGLLRLQYAAMEKAADLCLFGHTHRPFCEKCGDLWMVNPGACSGRTPTYAVAQLSGTTIHCEIKNLFLEE